MTRQAQAIPDTAFSASDGGPLSADHLRALSDARIRARKVRRAANVATFSGWTLAVFAAITLLSVLFGDFMSLLLGIGLSVVAYNELRGGAMLRRLDAAGARRLGYNQFALGVMIVGYAAWSLLSALSNPVVGTPAGATGDPKMDALLLRLNVALAWGLYGGIGVAGLVATGLTALYYFTRGRCVRAVLDQTPHWVIHAMRASA